MREVIAVDFDGTLCENAYPDIGKVQPEHNVIHRYVRYKKHAEDAIVILWTCRCGKELEAAISFCKKYNIPIDYVNENDPERVKLFGGDPRKVSADLYIDDKALGWHMFVDTLKKGDTLIELEKAEYENREWKASNEDRKGW